MNQKNNQEKIRIIAEGISKKIRLDKYLEITLEKLGYDISRNLIQKNIDYITLNGDIVKKNAIVKNNDITTRKHYNCMYFLPFQSSLNLLVGFFNEFFF